MKSMKEYINNLLDKPKKVLTYLARSFIEACSIVMLKIRLLS